MSRFGFLNISCVLYNGFQMYVSKRFTNGLQKVFKGSPICFQMVSKRHPKRLNKRFPTGVRKLFKRFPNGFLKVCKRGPNSFQQFNQSLATGLQQVPRWFPPGFQRFSNGFQKVSKSCLEGFPMVPKRFPRGLQHFSNMSLICV